MRNTPLRALLPFCVACSGSPADPAGVGTPIAPTTGGVAGETATGGATASGATGGATASGGETSTGGSAAGTGGSGEPVVTDCRLPALATTGVARPSGTPGNLKVLSWAGLTGAVSYTFDDANSSQIAHYPELQGLGVPMTFYIQTGKSTASDPIWAQAVLDGHELGNHTKSHAQEGSEADIDAATEFLQTTFGVRPYTMAAPYGDSSYQALAEPRFLINRGVSNAIIAPLDGKNPFNLPCFIPAENAAASVFNAQIDAARAAGGWRVVLVHGFSGGSDYAYLPVAIEEFVAGVNYAKGLGDLWIDSVVNVGAYWVAEKLLASLTPAAAGTDTTWSWTLPANFPPGKCLRVRVDGGTLTQSGVPLEWSDQGYYELSLDAGSVTLSP